MLEDLNRILNAKHHEVLRDLVEADNDATLPQLAQRLAARTGIQVSASTISRTLSKLNMTRKKRRCSVAG